MNVVCNKSVQGKALFLTRQSIINKSIYHLWSQNFITTETRPKRLALP